MIAELDDAADRSGILGGEVNFFDLELSFLGNDSDRAATGARGCDVDVIIGGEGMFAP